MRAQWAAAQLRAGAARHGWQVTPPVTSQRQEMVRATARDVLRALVQQVDPQALDAAARGALVFPVLLLMHADGVGQNLSTFHHMMAYNTESGTLFATHGYKSRVMPVTCVDAHDSATLADYETTLRELWRAHHRSATTCQGARCRSPSTCCT